MTTPKAGSTCNLFSRAWYDAPISEFLSATEDEIIGKMVTRGVFDLRQEQRDAWLLQIRILKSSLVDLTGSILLEFSIPRLGKRIDAVLLVGPVVFAVEFKVGATKFDRSAVEQVWDYALDLKNFHEASHEVSIVPVLVATESDSNTHRSFEVEHDGVYKPLFTNELELREVIDMVLQTVSGEDIERSKWANAPYRPTPTIIEAARALYANHSVEAIARYDAGAKNLATTSQRIEALVDEAKSSRRKIICFVTGVPGAGKTLVGLNVATQRRDTHKSTHAVFLSGNGPLVAVLREALTRDELERLKKINIKKRKGEVSGGVKAFIQNVHHFRDEALIDPRPPDDHIAIFDEAQRAWDMHKTTTFMRQKKNRAGFNQSEPEFLISYLDRHEDWAAIICLVGGGQEIYTGEAGIRIWLEAIRARFPHWHMYISSRLTDSEYAAGGIVDEIAAAENGHFDDELHLGVSMRSFRAESVSAFVKALLDIEIDGARRMLYQFVDRYPIAVTRDLDAAKRWIKTRARGSERYGMVASSTAQRLKPHAIDIRVDVNPIHWFLSGKEDTRSSYYLEDAATEFQVQGLEVDWALVTWDGDLRYSRSGWHFHDFRGSKWVNVRNADRQRYLRNAYRVLLTRARQGMVIFVPHGDAEDPTRSPEYYDHTFEYLTSLGIPRLV
ncbi:MAG: DUF2075 domain-containing protein [Candidatus Zixiibacteriota bacterium]